MLGSDAAAAVFSQADQEEIGKTVEDLKAQHSMAQQCQEMIFNKVKSLKQGAGKRKFTGSKTPFPPLSAGMTIEALLQQLPEGTKLECDKFNGRWKACWLTPHTKVWKTISRFGVAGVMQHVCQTFSFGLGHLLQVMAWNALSTSLMNLQLQLAPLQAHNLQRHHPHRHQLLLLHLQRQHLAKGTRQRQLEFCTCRRIPPSGPGSVVRS